MRMTVNSGGIVTIMMRVMLKMKLTKHPLWYGSGNMNTMKLYEVLGNIRYIGWYRRMFANDPVVGLKFITELLPENDPEMEPHYECQLGSVQVLYKHVFLNSGPPTPPKMLILYRQYKHFWSDPPPPQTCLYNT